MLGFITVIMLNLIAVTQLDAASSLYRLTNVHCESYNKTMAEFKYCRLKALKRDVTVFNMNLLIKIPADAISLNMQVLKKANGYKPFPINYTVDCCEFVKKHNHPFFNLIYTQFKKFSNINHTCPYVGEQILEGFYPHEASQLKLPWPAGNYLLKMTWYLRNIRVFSTDVYFTPPDA